MPVTITFIDLKYFVPNPHKCEGEPAELQLLQGNTGIIRPGMCPLSFCLPTVAVSSCTSCDSQVHRGCSERRILYHHYSFQVEFWQQEDQ